MKASIGNFISPKEKCEPGFEKVCFPAGKNPSTCICRLNKTTAKHYRAPLRCKMIIEYQGRCRVCTPGERRKGDPKLCRRGRIVEKVCPPQRRKADLEPGIVMKTGGIRKK